MLNKEYKIKGIVSVKKSIDKSFFMEDNFYNCKSGMLKNQINTIVILSFYYFTAFGKLYYFF